MTDKCLGLPRLLSIVCLPLKTNIYGLDPQHVASRYCWLLFMTTVETNSIFSCLKNVGGGGGFPKGCSLIIGFTVF